MYIHIDILYMYTCIHLLYYIISIFHSISTDKVKSVSKNPKGNKCDKGHSLKPFYIIVIPFFSLIISRNIFKIHIYKKTTTKHADKVKEYDTIFIVSLKKFALLCHLIVPFTLYSALYTFVFFFVCVCFFFFWLVFLFFFPEV